MRVDLAKMNSEVVTVLNKLDAKDSALKQDAWYKQVVRGASWSQSVTRTAQPSGAVAIGQSAKVQISDRADYLPYAEWKAAENRDARFTVRVGDYVVRGELEDDVTPQTLPGIIKAKGSDAVQVKAFRDLADDSASYASRGLESIMETLFIEVGGGR